MSQRVRSMSKTISLWIDPARGLHVQEKFERASATTS